MLFRPLDESLSQKLDVRIVAFVRDCPRVQ
jgi:hypothetical protein